MLVAGPEGGELEKYEKCGTGSGPEKSNPFFGELKLRPGEGNISPDVPLSLTKLGPGSAINSANINGYNYNRIDTLMTYKNCYSEVNI